jgi:cation diffusion facilitator CzcD-associated flavoprotein CzcO
MISKPLNACEVAVIGAGPYGLSVAAHLIHAGISTRVFGEPMSFWRHNMPKGMRLRSPWRATHISYPDCSLSLDAYACQHGIDRDGVLPVEEFVAYGEWFQARAVPDVDRRAVRRVEEAHSGFQLELSDGEILAVDRVVIATGLANQEYRPFTFRHLPAALVTHTCEHADFAPFRGKRVAVIGRGQSACESAALLAESGADVELISGGGIRWLGASTTTAIAHETPLWRLHDVVAAPSAVGPFPLSWLAELPAIVRHLPFELRNEFTRRCLKAGAAGWLKPRFARVKCNPGRAIAAARAVADQIEIDLGNGKSIFDHVVLGTGYRIDLSRIGILSPRLSVKIAGMEGSPLLGSGFESSVPKLHFVGSYAVKSYGPLMRFIAGAPFTARSVTKAALTRTTRGAGAEFPKAVARLFGRAAANLAPPR